VGEVALHTSAAWAEVACAVAFAPPMLGWLPAVGRRKRSATDLYRLTFGYCMILMTLVTAACAWFGSWRLHLAHGAASQPVAIVVGILFGLQTVIMFYLFAVGAAMNGAQGTKPPEHPFRFTWTMFCNLAYVTYLVSTPLALIVTVIGLLGL
jgi:hypothetical protein